MTTNTASVLFEAKEAQSDRISGDTNQETVRKTSEELKNLLKLDKLDPSLLTEEEIADLIRACNLSIRKLENYLANAKQCTKIRRIYYKNEIEALKHVKIESTDRDSSSNEPRENLGELEDLESESDMKIANCRLDPEILMREIDTEFDSAVKKSKSNCENVIDRVRLPVGLAEPLVLDGYKLFVPMATTEGCLVASTSRGLKALAKCGGVMSHVIKNSMTRAPVVTFQDSDLKKAVSNVYKAMRWLELEETKQKLRKAFQSNSKHTKLLDYTMEPSGRALHIRFEAHTGDAMGMNMCTIGASLALKEMKRVFPTMKEVAISGNMCADKKLSAINLIRGRGKSVITTASLKPEVVKEVLKVDVDSLIEVYNEKVVDGSRLAGSISGQNCHAANIVAAIFAATGQDLAQVVSSSHCDLKLRKDSRGSLEVNCSMKSIECGTVGGGTNLPDQAGFLALMGIKGSSLEDVSDQDSNACTLARIICATVMGAELSLMASLSEGTLVKSHKTLNRPPCNLV